MTSAPEGFTLAEWQDRLAAGRDLVKRESMNAWDWGDEALRVAPMGKRDIHTGANDALRQWMTEIECEIDIDTILSRRRVSDAWPGNTRVLPASWSVHREFMTLDDRSDIIKHPRDMDGHPASRWTVQAARNYVNLVKRDATTRIDIVDMLMSKIRDAVKQNGKSVIGLFESLTVPIPAIGDTGQERMLQILDEAQATIELLRAKVTGGDVDSALESILQGQ